MLYSRTVITTILKSLHFTSSSITQIPTKKIKAQLCSIFARFNKSKDLDQKQVPELRIPNGISSGLL